MNYKEQKRLKELELQIRPLLQEMENLRSIDPALAAQALVGKCFKYHNSYSGDGPKWWLYAKVTHVDDGTYAKSIKFEHTSSNRLEVTEDTWFSSGGGDGYVEISPAEFDAAWAKFCEDLANIDTTAAIAP